MRRLYIHKTRIIIFRRERKNGNENKKIIRLDRVERNDDAANTRETYAETRARTPRYYIILYRVFQRFTINAIFNFAIK